MPSQEFFSTAAQVIPVIFLVLALEVRSFTTPVSDSPRDERTIWKIGFMASTIVIMVLLVYAEVLAMRVLGGVSEPTAAARDAVGTGLAYGATMLVTQVLQRLTVEVIPDTSSARGWSAIGWSVLGLAAASYIAFSW